MKLRYLSTLWYTDPHVSTLIYLKEYLSTLWYTSIKMLEYWFGWRNSYQHDGASMYMLVHPATSF